MAKSPDRPTLLIVDDNAVDRERVLRLLGSTFLWREAATASAALDATLSGPVDCVLLDYRLPDSDGLETLDVMAARQIPVVMLTGQGDERIAVEAMKRGAQDYLVKMSLEPTSLRRSISNAMETVSLRRRLAAQRLELERRLTEIATQRAELTASNRALREREAELRMILGQLPAIVWTTDAKLRCLTITGALATAGIEGEDAPGRTIREILGETSHEELQAAHEAALAGTPGTFQTELRGRTLRGRIEPLRTEQGSVVSTIGVALDITETRQLEQQFRHAQKMEALGQLAGGIAHDFNNLLTAIMNFTSFATEELEPDHAARADLREVFDAANRGAGLIQRLLAFSRRRVEKPTVVDVNILVSRLEALLRALVGDDVQILLDLEAAPVLALAEPGGVEQIVVNLAVNARDAMARGGRLTISTRLATLDERLAVAGRVGLEPGPYVVLAVADEGPGIPADIRHRVFEPFFSTKGVGEGTGLGLSTCYGIAHQVGGGIAIDSEPDRGTTFVVYLPAARAAIAAPVVPSSEEAPRDGAGELVLIIEDDRQIRRAAERILVAAGYAAISVADADGARRAVAEHGDTIRVILSDVVMPGTAGPELVEDLLPQLPATRALYMSGYADATLRKRALLQVGAPVLEKPFSARALVHMVRELIHGPGTSDGT